MLFPDTAHRVSVSWELDGTTLFWSQDENGREKLHHRVEIHSVICPWNWRMAQVICENEAPLSALYENVFQHLLYRGICFLCQRELLLALFP